MSAQQLRRHVRAKISSAQWLRRQARAAISSAQWRRRHGGRRWGSSFLGFYGVFEAPAGCEALDALEALEARDPLPKALGSEWSLNMDVPI